MNIKPKTRKQWCLYRAKLSCKIGKDVLDGKTETPKSVSPIEYAIYSLLCVTEEIINALDEKE